MAQAPDAPQPSLIRQVIAGDRRAFDRLVLPHVPALLRLAQRMMGSRSQAEDAVQNALAAVWMARRRLDPDRPAAPYLTTATLNKCRDELRRQKAARFLGLGHDSDLVAARDDAPGPDVMVGDGLALSQVRDEIDRLPLLLKEALVLVTIEGHSHMDAAALLGVSPKTVEMRLYRARKRLREAIEIF